jgi:hypothetical protein
MSLLYSKVRVAWHPLARAALAVALLTCSAAALACADRSPSDDVPYARTGGIARVPAVDVDSNVGADAAGAAVAGGEAQGAAAGVDGNPDVPGIGGAVGSAGIPGVAGMVGSAGIPGIDEAAGGAGISGADTGDDDTAGTGGSLGIGPTLGRVGTNEPPVASFTTRTATR